MKYVSVFFKEIFIEKYFYEKLLILNIEIKVETIFWLI